LYSWVTASDKPKETVLKETLGPLVESHNYTSAMIRFRQLTDQGESRPNRIGHQRGLRR
jgi:hypothetical protein